MLSYIKATFSIRCMTKIVEKVVDSQLESYITVNNLYDPLQSAYKEFHSTETA